MLLVVRIGPTEALVDICMLCSYVVWTFFCCQYCQIVEVDSWQSACGQSLAFSQKQSRGKDCTYFLLRMRKPR